MFRFPIQSARRNTYAPTVIPPPRIPAREVKSKVLRMMVESDEAGLPLCVYLDESPMGDGDRAWRGVDGVLCETMRQGIRAPGFNAILMSC